MSNLSADGIAGVAFLQSFNRVVIVRSKDSSHADVRLTSDALVRGLNHIFAKIDVIHPDNVSRTPEDGACYIFHYDDSAAVNYIRSIHGKALGMLTVCLATDVYDYRKYLEIEKFTDLFFAPTIAHRDVLAAQLFAPVELLGEVVDPAAGFMRADANHSEESTRKARIVWFGYPESFSKSMSTLIPVIRSAIDNGSIECFHVISDSARFDNPWGLDVIEYDHQTFGGTLARYDYAVLSHISLDLAVNTYIKSPNKVVAALAAGIVPLASDTLNYGKLMRHLGLGKFLYSSPVELYQLLQQLKPRQDASLLRDLRVIDVVRDSFSVEKMVDNFLSAFSRYHAEQAYTRRLRRDWIAGRAAVPIHLEDRTLIRRVRDRLISLRKRSPR